MQFLSRNFFWVYFSIPLLLASCSNVVDPNAPSDSTVLAVASADALKPVLEWDIFLPNDDPTACVTMPHSDQRFGVGWTIVKKSNPDLSESNLAKLHALVSAELLTTKEVVIIENGQYEQAIEYSVTELGMQTFRKTGVGIQCFNAADLVLSDHLEKSAKKVPPDKIPFSTPNPVYKATIARNLINKASWFDNPDIQAAFKVELKNANSQAPLDVYLAKHNDVWIPAGVDVPLSKGEALLKKGLSSNSEPASEAILSVYRQELAFMVLPFLTDANQDQQGVDTTVSDTVLESIMQLAASELKTHPPGDVRIPTGYYSFNGIQMDQVFDENNNAIPHLGFVIDNFPEEADHSGYFLEIHTRTVETMEMLVRHKKAISQRLSAEQAEAMGLRKSSGVLYRTASPWPSAVKTHTLRLGEILNYQVRLYKDPWFRIKHSGNSPLKKSLEITVALESTPDEDAASLVKEKPYLAGIKYSKAVITALFTTDPNQPYEIRLIRPVF